MSPTNPIADFTLISIGYSLDMSETESLLAWDKKMVNHVIDSLVGSLKINLSLVCAFDFTGLYAKILACDSTVPFYHLIQNTTTNS